MGAKDLSRALRPVQVLVRFGFRLAIMTGLAMFANVGFGKGLVVLLWMSALICAVVAVVRREPPFTAQLNHWDEMAGYAALCALTTGIVQRL